MDSSYIVLERPNVSPKVGIDCSGSRHKEKGLSAKPGSDAFKGPIMYSLNYSRALLLMGANLRFDTFLVGDRSVSAGFLMPLNK